VVGSESDVFEEVGDAVVEFGAAGEAVDLDGFADDGGDAHAGVEGADGVLEDDLHLASEAEDFGGGGGEDVLVLVEDLAGGGGDESEDGSSDGGFAAAGFADESEGFARGEVEGDAIDGADVSDGLAEESAFDREVGFEVADAEERRGLSVGAGGRVGHGGDDNPCRGWGSVAWDFEEDGDGFVG
jgi:hypothetical protein